MIDVQHLINKYKIPVVKAYDGTVENMEWLLEHTRGLKGAEGFVVRFDDGHMIKIKADEYVMMHRAKDMIRFEKNVLQVIVEDKVDDLLPILNDNDRAELTIYHGKVVRQLDSFVYMIPSILKNAGDISRKDFALNVVSKFHQSIHSILYALFDNRFLETDVLKEQTMEMLKDKIKRAANTNAGVDKLRYILGDAKWKENVE